MPSNQQEQEYESQINQDKAQTQQQESVSVSSVRSTPKMDFVDLMLGLFIAGIFDFLSIIPAMGAIGIGLLTMWFWFKGIEMKKLSTGMIIGLIIELLPFISLIPAVMGFVIRTYFKEQAKARLPAPVKKVASVAVMPTKSLIKT